MTEERDWAQAVDVIDELMADPHVTVGGHPLEWLRSMVVTAAELDNQLSIASRLLSGELVDPDGHEHHVVYGIRAVLGKLCGGDGATTGAHEEPIVEVPEHDNEPKEKP